MTTSREMKRGYCSAFRIMSLTQVQSWLHEGGVGFLLLFVHKKNKITYLDIFLIHCACFKMNLFKEVGVKDWMEKQYMIIRFKMKFVAIAFNKQKKTYDSIRSLEDGKTTNIY